MEKSKFVLHLFTSKLTKTRSAAKAESRKADLQIHFKKGSLFTKYPKHICCSQVYPDHGYTMDINGCQALQLRLKDLGHEDGSRARWDAIGQIDWNVKSQRPTTSLQLFACWISAGVSCHCHFWNVAFRDFNNWLNRMTGWQCNPHRVEKRVRARSRLGEGARAAPQVWTMFKVFKPIGTANFALHQIGESLNEGRQKHKLKVLNYDTFWESPFHNLEIDPAFQERRRAS